MRDFMRRPKEKSAATKAVQGLTTFLVMFGTLYAFFSWLTREEGGQS
jgi:heme/copper-type cytochrome/quinol oxidase subunit 1